MKRFLLITVLLCLLWAVAARNEEGHSVTNTTAAGETHKTEAPKHTGADDPDNEDAEPAALLSEHQKILNYCVSAAGMLVVVLCIYVAHRAHKDWLSESSLVVLAGIVLGGVFFGVDELIEHNDYQYAAAVRFDQETFITLLLPIIIFEAGYSLQHGGVMRQIGTVMAFAIPGTLLSTIIIGIVIWSMTSVVHPPLYEAHGALFLCLTFGSLLSATDPVAVIAVLGSKYDLTKEPPLLYNLIFGESVLNDAVAIVLFHVFLDFITHPVTAGNVFAAIGTFLYIFFASAALGYVIGCISALFLKKVNITDLPHVEIITLIIFAAGSYYLSEYLHLSGIMSIFITARLMGIYSMHNLSDTANTHAQFLFKTAALLAETYVFLFLGAAVWAYNHNWNFDLTGATLVVVLISRAFVVFPISFLSNCRRKVEPITLKMQIFMWFAGLRGAIAFGLCVILMEEAEKHHREAVESAKKDGSEVHDEIRVGHARMLLTTGLGIILFMVLVMGSLSGPLLKALDLHTALSRGEIVEELKKDPNYEEQPPGIGRRLVRWINSINDDRIRPLLQRDYKHETEELAVAMVDKDDERV